MTEPERRAAELRTLLARLERQGGIIRRVGDRLERAAARASEGSDPEAVAATALYLQHFYTGIEEALLRIAEELDGSGPSGDEWHRLLLDQMSLDIPEVRPSVLSTELSGHLDVLRRFRHRVRHAYDEEYEWRRMAEPLAAYERVTVLLPAFFDRVEEVIREIVVALDEVGKDS
jgi:hypothetical protein